MKEIIKTKILFKKTKNWPAKGLNPGGRSATQRALPLHHPSDFAKLTYIS
jgi:hypothetical protein